MKKCLFQVQNISIEISLPEPKATVYLTHYRELPADRERKLGLAVGNTRCPLILARLTVWDENKNAAETDKQS